MTEYTSICFTGPQATHTLLGDRDMRGSIFPVIGTEHETARVTANRASLRSKHKNKALRIAAQIAAAEGAVADRLRRLGIVR